MIRQPITKKSYSALACCSMLAIVGFYCMLSYRQHAINPIDTTMPNLSQFVNGWAILLSKDASGNIWLVRDTFATGIRLFSGLVAGIGLSFVIGLGMAVYTPLEAIFKAPITFFGKIPPTAMLAVYFVLFGIDYEMYVAMVALGIFPSLAMSIFGAAKTDVSDHAIYKAYTLGASNVEVIAEVVVKQILPRIIDSIRLSIGPAMVFLIAAEWMMADVGFGYRLRIQSRMLNMNVVYTYLVILGLAGFAFDWILIAVRRNLCPWFDN